MNSTEQLSEREAFEAAMRAPGWSSGDLLWTGEYWCLSTKMAFTGWQAVVRASLQAPAEALDVDLIAQTIRTVDGDNRMGASMLAEHIVASLSASQVSAAPRLTDEQIDTELAEHEVKLTAEQRDGVHAAIRAITREKKE